MKTLSDYFEEKKNNPSDINEHLETFKRYSQECDVIVEMGVRWIVSTWAFLIGKPNKLTSIDIKHPIEYGADINEVYRIAEENGVEYEFRLADTLICDIDPCDLLFIDTWHDYLQLKKELFRHHSKVRKYIIFHDTVSFGFSDEPIDGNWNNIRETNLPKGLNPAIDEFCNQNPNWYIHERFANNNGITILKRLY